MNEAQQAVLREQGARGERARQIAVDPLFVGALTALKDAAWAEFISADPSDAGKLLRCRLKMELLTEIGQAFERHMQTGKLARNALHQFYEQAKRKLRRAA